MEHLAALLAELRREYSFYEKYVKRGADPSSLHDALWNPELTAQWSHD
jgi:hypothetical protein